MHSPTQNPHHPASIWLKRYNRPDVNFAWFCSRFLRSRRTRTVVTRRWTAWTWPTGVSTYLTYYWCLQDVRQAEVLACDLIFLLSYLVTALIPITGTLPSGWAALWFCSLASFSLSHTRNLTSDLSFVFVFVFVFPTSYKVGWIFPSCLPPEVIIYICYASQGPQPLLW